MLDSLGAAGGQWPLLADMSMIAGLYVISLIVGGGLLVVSAVFGGDAEADVDIDAGAEIDADVELDGELEAGGAGAGPLDLSSWFSMRFLIYFAAAFGLVGTALTWMSDASSTWVLASALIGGTLVGQIAHQLFRYLVRSSSNSATKTKDYINKTARVTVAIRPSARGEVAIRIGDRERFVPARARRDDDAFDAGATVGVVAFENGTARVVSKKEYEFTSKTRKGGTT